MTRIPAWLAKRVDLGVQTAHLTTCRKCDAKILVVDDPTGVDPVALSVEQELRAVLVGLRTFSAYRLGGIGRAQLWARFAYSMASSRTDVTVHAVHRCGVIWQGNDITIKPEPKTRKAVADVCPF